LKNRKADEHYYQRVNEPGNSPVAPEKNWQPAEIKRGRTDIITVLPYFLVQLYPPSYALVNAQRESQQCKYEQINRPGVGVAGNRQNGCNDQKDSDWNQPGWPNRTVSQVAPEPYHRSECRELHQPFPAVAVPAIHYGMEADRQRYDILQSIRTLTLLSEQHADKRMGGRLHFRTAAEMTGGCKEHPEWLRHSLEIAERCNFNFPFGKPQFPTFVAPDGSAAKDFLYRLVLCGLRERYGSRAHQFEPQVMEELGIIADVGYEDYFLITWDMLQECRRRGIEWITRGSAADSLVCYSLGISGVCPIRFDLYFRRFLNKERMALHKLPDIDIDFAHDRKDDVVALIFEKYGQEHCAVVGGFSTFQARSAFAEIAKVLGVAEREVRKFTDHFPWSFGSSWEPTGLEVPLLKKIMTDSVECRDLPLNDEPYKTALETAQFLDGMPRYPKMHPCGVVLSRQPMRELTPTFIANKGYSTTHFDMDAVEAVGLVKIDILAQGGLAAMRDVKSMRLNGELKLIWSDALRVTPKRGKSCKAILSFPSRGKIPPFGK